ncbi:MAG: acyl-CoA dehydrogenase family protein, partial [Porticoccaceae bacterium]|nr:acyl-CoA dehydrogenase family protein [Porticoccaceae bacterium]
MNFNLDEKYLTIQKRALELAREIEPMAVEADASSVVHQGVLKALQASGLCQLMVPAEYGGIYDTIDPLAICVVREAMMATSSHLDSLFALQGIGS